jgi:hypothetical protein
LRQRKKGGIAMITTLGSTTQAYTYPVKAHKEAAPQAQDSHEPICDGVSQGKSCYSSYKFSSTGSQSWKKIKMATLGLLGAIGGAVGGTAAATAGGAIAPVVLGLASAVTFGVLAGKLGSGAEGFKGIAKMMGWACVGGVAGAAAGVALAIAGGTAAVIGGGVMGSMAAGVGGILLSTLKISVS